LWSWLGSYAVEMGMPCIDFGLLHVDLVGIERRGKESKMIGSRV